MTELRSRNLTQSKRVLPLLVADRLLSGRTTIRFRKQARTVMAIRMVP